MVRRNIGALYYTVDRAPYDKEMHFIAGEPRKCPAGMTGEQ
jgi:hypothetical protein